MTWRSRCCSQRAWAMNRSYTETGPQWSLERPAGVDGAVLEARIPHRALELTLEVRGFTIARAHREVPSRTDDVPRLPASRVAAAHRARMRFVLPRRSSGRLEQIAALTRLGRAGRRATARGRPPRRPADPAVVLDFKVRIKRLANAKIVPHAATQPSIEIRDWLCAARPSA